MPAEQLERIAVRVFGRDRVSRVDDLPDAIQTAVNMVDEADDMGIGYGHGVLICGSFVTAGDARMLLKTRMNPDLAKPKNERIEPNLDAGTADAGTADADSADNAGNAGNADSADDAAEADFETDANPDFDTDDFGDFGLGQLARKTQVQEDAAKQASSGE